MSVKPRRGLKLSRMNFLRTLMVLTVSSMPVAHSVRRAQDAMNISANQRLVESAGLPPAFAKIIADKLPQTMIEMSIADEIYAEIERLVHEMVLRRWSKSRMNQNWRKNWQTILTNLSNPEIKERFIDDYMKLIAPRERLVVSAGLPLAIAKLIAPTLSQAVPTFDTAFTIYAEIQQYVQKLVELEELSTTNEKEVLEYWKTELDKLSKPESKNRFLDTYAELCLVSKHPECYEKGVLKVANDMGVGPEPLMRAYTALIRLIATEEFKTAFKTRDTEAATKLFRNTVAAADPTLKNVSIPKMMTGLEELFTEFEKEPG